MAQVAEVCDACREEIEDGEVGEEVSDELLVPRLSVARELFYPSDFLGDRFELLGRRLLGLKIVSQWMSVHPFSIYTYQV